MKIWCLLKGYSHELGQNFVLKIRERKLESYLRNKESFKELYNRFDNAPTEIITS